MLRKKPPKPKLPDELDALQRFVDNLIDDYLHDQDFEAAYRGIARILLIVVSDLLDTVEGHTVPEIADYADRVVNERVNREANRLLEGM